MSKKSRFISIIITAAMLLGMFPAYISAESYNTYTKAGFDDFVLDNSGTESSGSGSYSPEAGYISMNWTKGREINCVTAPSPETKPEGSSFTSSGEDKALEFNVISENTGSNYINIGIDTSSDMYSMDKIVFSMNTYIESYGYKGYLNVDLRKDSGNAETLFRLNNGGKIVTFSSASTTASTISRPSQKWFNMRFEFNPKEKTYDFYLDGIQKITGEKLYNDNLCFPGDPDTSKTVFTTIRMQMINTDATSYAKFYMDDIYIGAPVSEEPSGTPEATEEPSATPETTKEPSATAEPSETEKPSSSGQLETFNQSDFDNYDFDNSGTESTTAITDSYKGSVGSVWLSCQKGREINCVDAPSPETKLSDTSLTTGETDKALQFNVVSGNTGSCYIGVSFNSNTIDMYKKNKVILALNMYVESYGSKGYINADLRADSKNTSNLFRLSNGGKIIASTTDNGTAASVSRPNKKWFNLKFEFYPKTRTYDFYVDGVLQAEGAGLSNSGICFPGDPDSSLTPFQEFRMQMYSTDATSAAKFYIDDIFFGEEPTDELRISKLYFTQGDSPVVNIPSGADKICGKADVTYSKFVQNKDFSLIGALYDGSGNLNKLWTADSSLPDTQLAVNVYRTVTLDIPLSDVILDKDSSFKLFAFDGLNTMLPLAAASCAGMFTTNENVGENPSIHLVGDSICMSYGENTFPQQGWGYYIGDYFKDNVTVNNWSLGGRSTRSFIDEGRWNGIPKDGYNGSTVTTGVLNVIQPGDYVFVAMGHNDRSTDITTDLNGNDYCKGTTIDEYKDNLRKFAKETRLAGGNVIFVTSITEAGSTNYTMKKFVNNTLLERSTAMKEVANEQSAVVLDLNKTFWNEVTALGYQTAIDKYWMSKDTVRTLFRENLTDEETAGKTEEEIEALVTQKIANHPYNPIKNSGQDLTHLTDFGADHIAQIIADLLKESESPLKTLLEDAPDRSHSGKIQYNLYPDGLKKAVTFSFDDGKETDRDVVSVLNKYNLKGTFNLVPAWLDQSGFLTSDEIGELFDGHEVACHGYSHNRVDNLTPEEFETDLVNTQTYLKNLVGYDISGYAYPFGGLNGTGTITQEDVDSILQANNISYARLTGNKSLNSYNLPENFLRWSYQLRVGPESNSNTTADAFNKVQSFLNLPQGDKMQAMMLFAHGHEIQDYGQTGKDSKGWELFEELLTSLSGKDDVWYTTCADISEYAQSSYNLKIGSKTDTLKNPTDRSVWVTINGVSTKIMPNRVIKIK